MYLPFFFSCRSISQLSVRSLDRVKSTRHWAGNGIVQSSGMTLPVSAAFSSRACQILGASSSATQIFLPSKPISDPVMIRWSPCAGERDLDVLLAGSRRRTWRWRRPSPVRCRTKFSLGSSTASRGSRVASMVMSSAKKSGRTPKRPGHSTRSLPAPVPGSAWTETSPRLMRNLPATSAPFAVLKVASRHAPALVFSTIAMRSRRAAGSPAAVIKPQPQSSRRAAVLHGMDFHGRILLAQHGDNPAIAQDGVALEGAGRLAQGEWRSSHSCPPGPPAPALPRPAGPCPRR